MNRRRAARRAVISTTAASLALVSSLALFENDAAANPMDLAPERLTMPCTPKDSPGGPVPCGEAYTAPAGTGPNVNNYYRPDNAAWAKLVSQYAMAIAPTAMHPARTTGYGGFEMSLFGTITTVSKDEDFMKRGTEGSINNGKFSSSGSPDGALGVYGVTGRKGLPYGFELQATIGYIANTELVVMGGGIRLSPFEGFRKGVLGAFPDISVGGYVNTLTGTNKVKMTVPALDVQVSKPFVIANQLILQPYIGWQMVWVTADSGVVDATPATDGLKGCGARPPTPTEQAAGDTGEYHCQPGPGGKPTAAEASASKLDLNNNMVFNNVRFKRQRLFFGVSFKYEIAHLLLHAMTDITDPASGGDARIEGLARQWTLGMMTGVSW
jgi:hypothetical protein